MHFQSQLILAQNFDNFLLLSYNAKQLDRCKAVCHPELRVRQF